MKVKNTISVIFIAFLLGFSIPIMGDTPSTIDINGDDIDPIHPQSGSDPVTYEWHRTWPGSRMSVDSEGIVVDRSDNIYIVGSMDVGNNNHDLFLAKYDKTGVLLWSRTWGGDNTEFGNGIALDSSDNIYIVGFTYSFGAGLFDLCLVKYDSSGVQQWNRTWGGSAHDRGRGIVVDSSDNIYIVGESRSFDSTGHLDMVLMKYDDLGVLQWYSIYGPGQRYAGREIALDSSGYIYIVGYGRNWGEYNAEGILVKYDSSGVRQWVRHLGLSYGFELAIDSGDNIYISGADYDSTEDRWDAVLMKYTTSGDKLWDQILVNLNEFYAQAYGVAVDSSDNVYVVGGTEGSSESWDMFLVIFDSSGRQQLHRIWANGGYEVCDAVALDSSDDVYLVGTANLVKYKSDLQTFPPDITPPITTISHDGTIFLEDWYYPDFEITLSATDDGSGASFTKYRYLRATVGSSSGGGSWTTYTDPLTITSDHEIWIIQYRSTDFAGNTEITKSTLIKVIRTPIIMSDYLGIALQMLSPKFFDHNIPEGAEQHLLSANYFLLRAIDKCEFNMIIESFDHIKDSIEFMKLAVEKGLESSWTQEVINVIMFVLRYVVSDILQQTLDTVGEENKFIIRAIEDYNIALQLYEMEQHEDAVKFLKFSYRNIMKARVESISETFVSDLLDRLNEVQELKNADIIPEALIYLDQAENKILLAIDKANNSMIAQSLIQLKDAVSNLLDVQDFGLDTASIIDSILGNADDVTFLKILEAENILMGTSNRHIDKAWINYHKAFDYWNAGKYDFALSYYVKAIEKVNDALA